MNFAQMGLRLGGVSVSAIGQNKKRLEALLWKDPHLRESLPTLSKGLGSKSDQWFRFDSLIPFFFLEREKIILQAMRRLFVHLSFLLLLMAFTHAALAQGTAPSGHERLVPQISAKEKDPMVIEIIKLDYADAEHLARVIAALLTKEGVVVAYRPTNSLIIKDRASVVRRLFEIIKGKPGPQ